MKVSIKKYIISYLILFLIFMGIDAVYALTSIETVKSANPVEGTLCSVSSSRASNIKIKLDGIGNGNDKYGYVYDLSINGERAFCLTMGVPSGKIKSLKFKAFHDNGALDKDVYSNYYRAYQYYLVHGNNPETFIFIQAAFWYFSETGKTSEPLGVSIDELSSFLSQALFTSRCSEYESGIATTEYLGERFSCNCFLDADCEQLDKSGLYRLTVNEYMHAVYEYLYERSNGQYNIMNDIASKARTTAAGILVSSLYNGNLYYWQATEEGKQDFISTAYLCDDEPESCELDLGNLLDKYSINVRTNNNSSYMTELNKLKQKYPTRLNMDDITNPSCSTPPPTLEPECNPLYEEYACKFTSNNGGFLITDTGSETDNACWLGAGISYNYGSDKVSSDTNLGNKYCPVRCYEAFGADFPGAIDNIKAGTFFFWGRGSSSDGYLGNLNAVRYCQTVGIDYGTFRNDFNANEGDIQTAYDSYVAQKKYNAKSGYDSTEKCTLNATCEQTGTKSAGCSGHYWEYGGKCITMDAGDPSCSKPSNQGGHPGGSPLGPACITGEKPLDTKTVCNKCPTGYNDDDENGTCEKDGTEYKRNSVNYNGQQSTSKSKCMESNSSSSDIDAALDDATELSSRATTLQGLIDKREGLTHLIRSCQSQEFINKNNTDLYTFKGEVKLNYTDPAGINRNIDGATLNRVDDVSVSDSGVLKSTTPESFTCRDTSEYTGASNYSGCFGDSTTPSQTFTLTNYASYSWKYTGLFKYYYPANEYSWKAIVENAHVVNEKTYTADYSGMKIVPYKVGYGIPTAFSLITGFYNIGVDISGFGHNGHFDKVMQKEENVSVYNYACPYKVVNELYGSECNWDCNYGTRTCTLIAGSPEYCKREVKGIDLVYRLIEMPNNVNLETRRKTVFPSIDGDGRAPGANWEKFINEHTTGFTNVTSNNVVYDNNSAINTYGPIYEIELTPSAISQIREDTLSYRNTDKDPYTSYTDANNHEKVICKGDHTERTCASNYITELIQSNIITGGYYLKCNSCRNNTNERLDWIDSQKERFY